MISLTEDQKRVIDRSKEELVGAAERMLNQSAILKIKFKDLGDRQFNNLVAIALETESPAVVKNFIRYQVGRDAGKEGKNRKGWSYPNAQGKNLGEQIIEEIDDGVIKKTLETIPELNSSEKKQLAQIELIRHFLGFTSRHLKYLNIRREEEQKKKKWRAS